MKYLAILVLVFTSLGSACSRSTNSNARGNRGPGGGNGSNALNPAEQTPESTPIASPTPDPQEAVRKLVADLGAALLRSDVDALDKLYSNGYLHINDNGQLVTKADIINGVRQGTVKYASLNIEEINVRVYGDTAVTNANFIGTSAGSGGGINLQDRATLVAARENDGWRFVNSQLTPMRTMPQSGSSKSPQSGTRNDHTTIQNGSTSPNP